MCLDQLWQWDQCIVLAMDQWGIHPVDMRKLSRWDERSRWSINDLPQHIIWKEFGTVINQLYIREEIFIILSKLVDKVFE